jgi:hypothetical protein
MLFHDTVASTSSVAPLHLKPPTEFEVSKRILRSPSEVEAVTGRLKSLITTDFFPHFESSPPTTSKGPPSLCSPTYTADTTSSTLLKSVLTTAIVKRKFVAGTISRGNTISHAGPEVDADEQVLVKYSLCAPAICPWYPVL